jgi:hypothetical protein
MFTLRKTSVTVLRGRTPAAQDRHALATLGENIENWTLVQVIVLRSFGADPLYFLKLCMIRHEKR